MRLEILRGQRDARQHGKGPWLCDKYLDGSLAGTRRERVLVGALRKRRRTGASKVDARQTQVVDDDDDRERLIAGGRNT